MKRFLLALSVLFAFSVQAQDYQFDYLLEYVNGSGDPVNYYINSKDKSYVLNDSEYQNIIREDYVISFNISLKGEKRITSVFADKFEDNPAKVEEIKWDHSIITENGFKCRKYIYKTLVVDGEGDEAVTRPITYEMYIMDDPLNTLATLNQNELLFPDNIKFEGLPKGTIVRFKNIEDDYFSEYDLLILKKITKLDKPVTMEIDNKQVMKFLLKNQD